ncbi:MAG: YdbL family protein [Thiotrichales bacterium]|nr:MAG: YdbL family protein [Thiotrichales bacterium]
MRAFLTVLTTCLLLVAQPVFAIDLQTAKDKGLVGETPSGYLGAVNQPTAEVKDLINSINAQRKQKFKEIAARNNTSLEAVEQLAGKKAIEKSRPGSYIKVGGSWQQK